MPHQGVRYEFETKDARKRREAGEKATVQDERATKARKANERKREQAKRADSLKKRVEEINRVIKTPALKQVKEQAKETMILRPVLVPPPAIVDVPTALSSYSLIPKSVAIPTATMVDALIPGRNVPYGWTTAPASSLIVIAPVIGAMMVMIGKRVAVSMAMIGLEYAGQQLISQYGPGSNGVNVRFHTGKGHGRGAYQRLRPEGGEIPQDDADPYDPLSEWDKFWNWIN